MSDVTDILARYRAPAAAPNADEPSASPVSDILAKYRAPATAPAPAPPPQPSKVESFAQGAISGGTLSFADEVQAALDTAVSKIPGVRTAAEASRSLVARHLPASEHLPVDNPDLTYQQRRDFLRRKGHEAEVANPKAYLAGELVGGTAPALAVPGVAGAKTIGQVAKVGAKAGAILGAGGGLGASDADLTHGDVVEALRDTLVGAGTGAVGGAVIGGAAAAGGRAVAASAGKARKILSERFGRVFGSEVLGASKPKDVQAWGNILDRELDPVKHQGVTQTAEQFLVTPEMRAVEQAAHGKDLDRAQALVKEAFAKREPGRVADYARIDAEHGQFNVGKGLDAIERDARRAANGPKKDGLIEKELQIARKNWVDDYSSIPADVLQRRIGQRAGLEGADTATSAALDALGKELPTAGLVTRTEIQRALEKTGEHAEVGRWLDKEVLDPQTGLLTWDPKATIPAIEMRSVVTSAQDKANTALGMLNATPNWQKSNAVKKAVNRALDDYLEAAAASSKGLRRTVTDIRQRDIELSVLAAARDGLRSTATKENVGEFKNVLGKVAQHASGPLAGAYLASAGADVPEDIGSGHPLRALRHGAEAAVGLGLLGRAAVNRASRSHLLDTLLRAAEGGNPRAQALLAKYGGALGAEQAGGR